MSTTTTLFHAGGVSQKASEWEKITNNDWVKQMVKGVCTELLSIPPQMVEPTSDNKGKDEILNSKSKQNVRTRADRMG